MYILLNNVSAGDVWSKVCRALRIIKKRIYCQGEHIRWRIKQQRHIQYVKKALIIEETLKVFKKDFNRTDFNHQRVSGI